MIMLYCSLEVGYVALTLNGNYYKKVEFIWLENQQVWGSLLLGDEGSVPLFKSATKITILVSKSTKV